MSAVAVQPFFRRQVETFVGYFSRRGRSTGEEVRTLDALLAPDCWRRERRADPELTKVLSFIQEELGVTRYLLTLPAGVRLEHGTPFEELRSLLDVDVEGLSIDGAWELRGALKLMNLRLGDACYVASQLEYERGRSVDDWHPWTKHFPAKELRELITSLTTEPIDPADRRRAVDRLRKLYRLRAEAGRNRRATAALKCRYMSWLGPLLLLLIVGLGGAIHLATGGALWRPVVLTAAAGALGSTLSGVFMVRDHLARLNELRGFSSTMRVQPFTGACAGLVLLLVIKSKTIVFGSVDPDFPTPAALALLAFAAGFSEPFFLGIVQRVAVIPDPEPAGAAKVPQNSPA